MELTGGSGNFWYCPRCKRSIPIRGAFFERALSFHSGALGPEQTYDRAGATAPVKREISGKAEL